MNVIKDTVSSLFLMYGTLNPFELCEHLNIKIIISNLGNEIKGFFQRTHGYEMIHINSGIEDHEMKYVCAHELGHAILHSNMSISYLIENPLQVKNKFEIQADKFAAEILINYEIKDQGYGQLDIEQISSLICVPTKLIKYKLNI
ncbi:ImmA/IrrE family metallo-endopeptidase [Clostridium estertheticum]|uniref:ImmA/IrrE family metallo-endopeptidase n=1 Tax=Clostridium estertheticum TaxID=238834 RepID=A0A7Y3SU40_9CLOT|nr:ImmA/IrrE family metallo-endopeptidase [Clostridium estertheticum]NNU75413.1 ImmA/IrrE family metallo-endopeptidase [Clostridium estertheticum]WBL47034.1 ImmA/IrrE family metallo-endopeptidase [Clostridium estertheticum]